MKTEQAETSPKACRRGENTYAYNRRGERKSSKRPHRATPTWGKTLTGKNEPWAACNNPQARTGIGGEEKVSGAPELMQRATRTTSSRRQKKPSRKGKVPVETSSSGGGRKVSDQESPRTIFDDDGAPLSCTQRHRRTSGPSRRYGT